MPDLFVDTSGWGHLVDSTQPYHRLAANIYRTARQQGRKVITTNYIIAELVLDHTGLIGYSFFHTTLVE